MNIYLSVLEEAIRAIGFLNDTQFTWFGVASEALSPAVRQAITRETTQGFLRHELRHTLYSQFYTKGTPRPYAEEAGWVPDDVSFVATLAAANQSKDSVENGWTARGFRDGRIVVDRRGLSLEVPQKSAFRRSRIRWRRPSRFLCVPQARDRICRLDITWFLAMCRCL